MLLLSASVSNSAAAITSAADTASSKVARLIIILSPYCDVNSNIRGECVR